jgi:hypothetical protein
VGRELRRAREEWTREIREAEREVARAARSWRDWR